MVRVQVVQGAHLCVPPVQVTVPLVPLALTQQVAVLLGDERRSGHTENNVFVSMYVDCSEDDWNATIHLHSHWTLSLERGMVRVMVTQLRSAVLGPRLITGLTMPTLSQQCGPQPVNYILITSLPHNSPCLLDNMFTL